MKRHIRAWRPVLMLVLALSALTVAAGCTQAQIDQFRRDHPSLSRAVDKVATTTYVVAQNPAAQGAADSVPFGKIVLGLLGAGATFWMGHMKGKSGAQQTTTDEPAPIK
jgi:hypothetical protein